MSGLTEQMLMYTVNPISPIQTHTQAHTHESSLSHAHTQRSFQFGFLSFFLYFVFWEVLALWLFVANEARLKIKHSHRSTFNVDKIYRFVRGFIDKIFKPRMKLKFTKIKQRKEQRKLKEL